MMFGVGTGPRGLLVRALGQAWVQRGSAREALPDPALRSLLAALAVRANEPVPQADLIAAVWGPRPHTSAEDALGTRVSRLRSLLEPAAEVAWEGTGYVLRVDPGRIDAVRFERLVTRAAAASAPRDAVRLADRALALWSGPVAFPELRPGGRRHPESLRLGELRWRAVELLARGELALGQAGEAADRLLEVVAVEPFRERLCALALTALHRAGRSAEAVETFRQVRARLDAELGVDPSVELREAYRAVTGEPPERLTRRWPVRAARRPPPTTLLGRDSEQARLTALVGRERLITVTGGGGAGKTRLVLETLATLDTQAPTVELAALAGDEVPLAVAAALGVHAHGSADETLDAVADHLSGQRLLLVLDNCEHVLTEVRSLAKRVLPSCPSVTLLATSRVPLGVGGERVLPLAPLPADPHGEPLTSLSGALFLARARRVRPQFVITPEQTGLLRGALLTMDCLPLNLELAASRAAVEGVAELEGLPRDVVEWAFDRLDPADRDLLASLTVFRGEFDLGAADEVADAGGAIAAGITRLAELSLLTVEDAALARFRVPELVRQVAARHLTTTPQEHKTRDRHARWCLDLATAAAADATGEHDLAAAERLRRNASDLTGALRWAVGEDQGLAAELAGRLGLLSPYRSEVDFLAWQLRLGDSEHPLAVGAAARAAVRYGDLATARRLAERAAGLATTAEQRYLALHTLALSSPDVESSRLACHELLGLSELAAAHLADGWGVLALLDRGDGGTAAGATHTLAVSSAHRAYASYVDGMVRLARDPEDGVAALGRARTLAQLAGAELIDGAATSAQAGALLRLGRLPEAAKLLTHSLEHWQRVRAPAQLEATTRQASELLAALGAGEVPGPAALSTLGAVHGTLAR
ncbi:ATP-binding protein [Prauserella cavernicola]|uniref:Winged helix-turn-helix domain-containing protein n=1 Tax=Prauserella cavernicola TaxID=2800127 RepID=A0A934QRL1_9PSEU|nr:BTAD domain-containing putative transcriptional regulator [Prauserella cavernicola]MBK1784399.1 winged helix-turn-helix domain-containing protein [Prauserella cavernicola]